jgi:apolipoprotein N-acyltransferase
MGITSTSNELMATLTGNPSQKGTVGPSLIPFPSLIWVGVGGLVTALAFPLAPIPIYPPVALWPLAWVGLVPFLARLFTCRTLGESARTGLVFGFTFYVVAAVWVFRVFDVLGWILIWFPVVYIVLFTVAARLTQRAGCPPALTWPILWMAAEFSRSEWSPVRLELLSDYLDPFRFSWLLLGHSRLSFPLLGQTADLWGGYGLSLAPFLVNLLFASAWVARRTGGRLPRFLALATTILLGVEIAYGTYSMLLLHHLEERSLPVAVVQSERASLAVHRRLTEELLLSSPQTKVVVWPEYAFTQRKGELAEVEAFARKRGILLIAGFRRLDGPADQTNVACWIAPEGPTGIYVKHERVPFAEWNRAGRDYPTFPFEWEGIEVPGAIAICYDVDFPEHVRRLTQAGATWVAVPTKDIGSWGGTEHAQHAMQARLRAIENRRPIVQAATSGVSQIIDDQGQVVNSLPFKVLLPTGLEETYLEGSAVGDLYPRSRLSLYTRGGYLVAPAITVLAGLLVVWSLVPLGGLRPLSGRSRAQAPIDRGPVAY